MKSTLLFFIAVMFYTSGAFAQNGANKNPAPVNQVGKIKWSIDPFEHAIFVENTGQFTLQPPSGGEGGLPGEQVLFEAKLGSVDAFFTSKGIIYRHIEWEPRALGVSKGDPDENGPPERKYYYLHTTWDGANSSVTVSAADEDKLPYYYTYPKGYKNTYTANVYRKITYHNLYPGIDVEYSFPEGSSNLEYSIVVHPGADLSKLRLKYDKSLGMNSDKKGEIVVKNEIGTLTESAPVACYLEDHQQVSVTSEVANSPFETFAAGKTDATKTLVIDPAIVWTTDPNFASTGNYDFAYDLDYDNAGNVYVYGGGPNPFQLVKLNPAGIIQWVFNATVMSSSTNFYGDFAVDKHSQSLYTVEGWNSGGGARVCKISPTGTLVATTHANDSLTEMWRIVNNICPYTGFVIFGGGFPTTDQVCMLDTTLGSVINPSNVLATNQGNHDFTIAAVDPSGTSAYAGTTQSLKYPGNLNNCTVQCPVPGLVPSTYITADGYTFKEISCIYYDPNTVFNGMNGMACSPNWLYEYDGFTLKQLNKATGAINASTAVSALSYHWGGLDVDICENIYVGNAKTIDIYNSSLTLASTLPPLPDTVYDLAVGPYPGQLVYACGQKYVCVISMGPPVNAITITNTPTHCTSCDGTATATLTICGSPVNAGLTYRWSDGQTTQTAINLCSAFDTVTITYGCNLIFKDTVTIPRVATGLVLTRDSTPANCGNNTGSAGVVPVGGKAPFVYSWSNGSVTSSTGPVGAGVYCVKVTDNSGCYDSVCITVKSTALPVITIKPNPVNLCPGGQATLTASGAVSYVWTPASGLSCTACASPIASPASTTIYTVVGTDANGCTNKDSVTVTILPQPNITTTGSGNICFGQSLVLSAGGGVSYVWSPAKGLSCTNCPNPTASPTVTTTYTVVGTDGNGCTNKDSATVTIFPIPVITATSSPDSICLGATVTLNATGGISYSWLPSAGLSCNNCQSPTVTPSQTTTYTVTATDANGCTNTAQVTVYVNTPPTIVVTPDVKICTGSSVTLIASLTTGGQGAFTWQPGPFTGPSITVTPTVTTTYTVSFSNGCGTSTGTIHVSVNPMPVTAFLSYVTSGCVPLCIQFYDLSTVPSGKVSYWSWKFGNGDSSNAQNPIYCYPDTGLYTVTLTATSDSGCSTTLKKIDMIDVFAKPIASFTLSPQPTTILQPTIQFTDQSTDVYGKIAYWWWRFGDNDDTVITRQNPVHTYHDTGTYCPKLIVQNIHGCTDTAINCLIISPLFSLYIPNAFTPNSDGLNDTFKPKGTYIKTFDMYIFDRWGMQLFHSTDINIGWPGTVQGHNTVCQEDTYVYLITVTDVFNIKHNFTGIANLIR